MEKDSPFLSWLEESSRQLAIIPKGAYEMTGIRVPSEHHALVRFFLFFDHLVLMNVTDGAIL